MGILPVRKSSSRNLVVGASLLLPQHHVDNTHHLHKDLIMKVAFLLVHFQLQPADTRLYLLEGNKGRFAHHALFTHTLDAVLQKVIYPFEKIVHLFGQGSVQHR